MLQSAATADDPSVQIFSRMVTCGISQVAVCLSVYHLSIIRKCLCISQSQSVEQTDEISLQSPFFSHLLMVSSPPPEPPPSSTDSTPCLCLPECSHGRPLRLRQLQGVPVRPQVHPIRRQPLLHPLLRQPLLQHLRRVQGADWPRRKGERAPTARSTAHIFRIKQTPELIKYLPPKSFKPFHCPAGACRP